jgi:hypothetical protein
MARDDCYALRILTTSWSIFHGRGCQITCHRERRCLLFSVLSVTVHVCSTYDVKLATGYRTVVPATDRFTYPLLFLHYRLIDFSTFLTCLLADRLIGLRTFLTDWETDGLNKRLVQWTRTSRLNVLTNVLTDLFFIVLLTGRINGRKKNKCAQAFCSQHLSVSVWFNWRPVGHTRPVTTYSQAWEII